MMIERLERLNEWWFTGKVRDELAPPFKRHAFQRILSAIKDRQIMIITGLRRTGKTTLMYQAIERLLETESPKKVLYYSFEDPSPGPEEVLGAYEREILKKPFEDAGRVYVFFDEIQYASHWAAKLKQFYDLYPNMKFFVSGSSSLLLSEEALERLAGRFFFLELKPLTFLEFLEIKGAIIEKLDLGHLRAEILFAEYMMKSGFPEITSWEDERKVSEYIRNAVIDRAIMRDMPMVFGKGDLALSESLLGLILSSPGLILNVNSISESLGRSRITVSNYLKLIEASLLVRTLSNFRPSSLSSSRKLKKAYPATTSLVFAFNRDTFKSNTGGMLETYAVNALGAKHYFREGNREIDIILGGKISKGQILPIEVKAIVGERDLKKFSSLVDYIGAKSGMMISQNQSLKYGTVEVIPAYQLETILQRWPTEGESTT